MKPELLASQKNNDNFRIITTTPFCEKYNCDYDQILKQCMPDNCSRKLGVLYFFQIFFIAFAISVNLIRFRLILKKQHSNSDVSKYFRYTQIFPDILLSTVTNIAAIYATIVTNNTNHKFNSFFIDSVGFFTVFSISVKICSSALFVYSTSENSFIFFFLLWIVPSFIGGLPIFLKTYQMQTTFLLVFPSFESKLTTGILAFYGFMACTWTVLLIRSKNLKSTEIRKKVYGEVIQILFLGVILGVYFLLKNQYENLMDNPKISMIINSLEYCTFLLVTILISLGNFVSQWLLSAHFREAFKNTVISPFLNNFEENKQKIVDISSEKSSSESYTIRPISVSSDTIETNSSFKSRKHHNFIERSLTQYKPNPEKIIKIAKSNSFVIKRDRVDLERRMILDKINKNLKLAINDDFFKEDTPKVVEHGSLRLKTNFAARNGGCLKKF